MKRSWKAWTITNTNWIYKSLVRSTLPILQFYHLDSGEVLLPPQVLLVLRSQRRHQVVRIHDDVHERVEEAEERGVTAWGELDSEPNRHWHYSMVDHVEGGNVVVFLSQDKEKLEWGVTWNLVVGGMWGTNRVKKFGELGNEVPPAALRHLEIDWLVGIRRKRGDLPSWRGGFVSSPRVDIWNCSGWAIPPRRSRRRHIIYRDWRSRKFKWFTHLMEQIQAKNYLN